MLAVGIIYDINVLFLYSCKQGIWRNLSNTKSLEHTISLFSCLSLLLFMKTIVRILWIIFTIITQKYQLFCILSKPTRKHNNSSIYWFYLLLADALSTIIDFSLVFFFLILVCFHYIFSGFYSPGNSKQCKLDIKSRI